jgi:predicted MFS family arabinose efflux permease
VTNRRASLLAALATLYVAQGVPFGFATEYLPVVLRKAHYSMTSMGAVMLLQLPWQLKVFYAGVADRPWARMRTRGILLFAQVLLGIVIAAFAIAPFSEAPVLWFVLTVLAALVASTQDVFVDATAVRALSPSDRGLGNTAQVAGYRLGMLFGGAWLLLLIGRLGNRWAVLSCGAIVLATAIAAFVMREGAITEEQHHEKPNFRGVFGALFGRESWAVLAIALTFKMGIHIVTVPMKAMPVDAKWTPEQIGLAVVIVGTTCGLAGAGVGGFLHTRLSERTCLAISALLQALVCVPLLMAHARGAPIAWTSAAIAVESFASGMGTTVLFAALMSATRRADAGLHYTLLTGSNAIALWIGGIAGGFIADRLGKPTAFVAAAIVCLMPISLLRDWDRARSASAR